MNMYRITIRLQNAEDPLKRREQFERLVLVKFSGKDSKAAGIPSEWQRKYNFLKLFAALNSRMPFLADN